MLIQGKSKQAFSKNVETEMNAGKPSKQALAIAYGIKRKNMKAKGGMISPDMVTEIEDGPMNAHDEDIETPAEPKEMVMVAKENMPMSMMAKGGMMGPGNIAKMIMAKKYEKGGMVDDFLSDEESAKDPGSHDDDSFDDPDREDQMSRKDMMSRIMNSLHSKHMGR